MLSYVLLVSFYTAFIIIVQASSESVDWCSLDCLVNDGKIEKNTMCKYKHQKSTGTCRNIRSSMTPNKRKELLHLHNEIRNYMAAGEKGWPAASNMRQISWDGTLELVARRWAEQCKQGYDACRRTPKFQDVGQNYGMLAATTDNPDSSNGSVEGWISWMSKTNQALLSSYQHGDWGVFTQIIWATTYKLGCAQVQFSEKQNDVDWKRTVVVCNYGPAGNVVENRIYLDGKPCTKCTAGTSCKPASSYSNLCALPSDDTQPKPISIDISLRSGGIISLKQNLVCILTLFVMLHITK